MTTELLTTFYIARHGETEWNLLKKVQGHADSPLTLDGEKQAGDLAEELKQIPFDIIFSSDLMRAHKTAAIVALERKLEVQTSQLLREANFGTFEGQPHDIFRTYDDLFNSLSNEEKYVFRPNEKMETDEEIAERMSTFIRETAVVYPGKNVLAISHGSIMRAMLIKLGFGNYDTLGRFRNLGYFVLETDGRDTFVKKTVGIDIFSAKRST